jgi:4-amino-4-deoxy-L-arabinose transferase-like glycosyltransferase
MFINRMPLSLRALVLVALALALILPGLGHRDITTSHEARVVQTARAMVASGTPWNARLVETPVVAMTTTAKDVKRLRPIEGQPPIQVNPWLVPIMSGEIRLQKPPLPYWLAAICFKLFDYSEASARLPGALMMAAAVALVFDLGRRTLGKRVGWYAAFAWISLYFVYDEHRKAMADPSLAFFSLLAVWAWVVAGDAGIALTARNSSRCVLASLLLFYLAMGLGTLAKGPLILLHVIAALGALHCCTRRRFPGKWWQHLLGIALLALIALPWPMYVFNHIPNAIELWRYELANKEKPRGLFFYFPELLQIAAPWTAVWILQMVTAVARWRGAAAPRAIPRARRELFPILWLAVVFLVLSAFDVKKNAYLLPELPAIALSVGAGLRWLVLGLRIPRLRRLSHTFIVAMIVVGAVAGLSVWPARHAAFEPPVWPGDAVSWGALAAISIATATIFGLVPALALMRRSRRRHWPVAQGIVLAVATAFIFNFVVAPNDNRRSAKAACTQAMALLAEGHRTLSTDLLAEEVAVYLPLDPADAIPAESRFASKVLFLRDDADGVEARRRKQPVKPFDPTGWRIDGGEVIVFHQVPLPDNPGDVRWQLWELTVSRTIVVSTERREPLGKDKNGE